MKRSERHERPQRGGGESNDATLHFCTAVPWLTGTFDAPHLPQTRCTLTE